MKLSAFKVLLEQASKLKFQLPNSSFIPSHFHITEVGVINKYFIDCGGKVRQEHKINLQLWYSVDLDHRLSSEKLLSIVNLSEEKLSIGDLEIEVEYQSDTIGKYNLAHNGEHFQLTKTQTTCLAEENCGIPVQKVKVAMNELTKAAGADNCCTPGGGCC